MNKILNKIRIWGYEKNIIDPSDSGQLLKQYNKFLEEAKELEVEIKAGARNKIIDELGDVIVTCEMQAANIGTTLQHCAETAYKKISKRKGKTIDGTFVKEADL